MNSKYTLDLTINYTLKNMKIVEGGSEENENTAKVYIKPKEKHTINIE